MENTVASNAEVHIALNLKLSDYVFPFREAVNMLLIL